MGEVPAERPRPWWRWPLLGCVIALGVAAGILIASVSCLAILGYFAEEAIEELREGERIAPSVALGQPVTIDGLQVVVDRYEISDGAEEAPAPGAQFLWVHIAVQNVGDVPIDEAVLVKMEYKGTEMGESFVYDPARPPFPASLRLFPDVGAEGWVAFQVPLALELSQVSVIFKEVFHFPARAASWRLVEPENANER
ncbi:MAG: DUF4352 domain-containing protein [Dehalococcoidia bacterium]